MIRVHGLAQVRRKLIALNAAEERAARTAVARTALKVQADAKEGAPVDTGRLRNSIAVEQEGLRARVGTNVTYAPFQELGTRYQPARPFLFPAAEQNRDDFHREISRLVREGARRVG